MTQPHGPQWPGHWAGAVPPRRPSRGPAIAAVVSGAALAVVILVIALTVPGGDDRPSAGSGFRSYPGATTSDASPSPSPSGPAETTTTMSPPAPTTTLPSPSAAPGPRKVLKLADHPLLRDPEAGLQNLACHLPAWRSDQASAEAFFTAARRCLDAAWRPLLEHYDLPFSSPELHFPKRSSFQTECGTIQVGIATAAYYCENDLYVPFAGLQTDQYGDSPGVYLALFAHEYGHHVQELAGIMDAAWERIYAVGQDSPAGQEMSRRKELQAQCFSGMFLGSHVERGGSITREMYENAWRDQDTRGDDTSGTHDHGSNAHYAGWWRTGAVHNRIAQCNTFAAAPADVS
ncbi:hypothetical protein B0I33_11262 [Prauserella shujinwangii]|uniref:Metalloprotease n=1 Tax=Prauserella shujinwangii TaxID=1453103 RepID=A0A2T0LM85_9PSEU|nr:neutral zinc metallopeptidase [Prauserella shujinwangii]PRX44184.1 hypothetical protein B0I33_11262 [Prauserella shujinwangii]